MLNSRVNTIIYLHNVMQLTQLEFIDLIQIVAGAQEFRENTPLLPADVELLRAIDSTIKEELENKFGEKYEIANEVRLTLIVWNGQSDLYRTDGQSVPGYRRKARTLLFAHLLRIDFNNKEASAAEINHVRAGRINGSVFLIFSTERN